MLFSLAVQPFTGCFFKQKQPVNGKHLFWWCCHSFLPFQRLTSLLKQFCITAVQQTKCPSAAQFNSATQRLPQKHVRRRLRRKNLVCSVLAFFYFPNTHKYNLLWLILFPNTAVASFSHVGMLWGFLIEPWWTRWEAAVKGVWFC